MADIRYDEIVTIGLKSPLEDIGIDYVEMGLDTLIDNEIVKEIPVVKTIASVTKVGLAVKEWNFAKKFLAFLSRYHSGVLMDDEKNEFLNKYSSDAKYREKVVTLLVTMNDRFFDANQAKICGNLFVAYIKGYFDWESFESMCECVDRFVPFAASLLDELEQEKEPYHRGSQSVGDARAAVLISCAFAYQWGTHLYTTMIGMFVHQYGIKADFMHTPEEVIEHSWARLAEK